MTAIAVGVNRTHKGKLPRDAPRWQWSQYNKSFTLEVLEMDGIVEVITQGYSISAAHHTNREAGNFISAQHVGLDFDTEDVRSTLAALERDPFIGKYAAILHTTSSHRPDAPRARILFILDEAVRDAQQYARYQAALTTHFEVSDEQCKDAARLWFGAPGCEVRTFPDNVLPVAVLEDLAAQQEAALTEDGETFLQESRNLDIDTSIDTTEALDMTIRNARAGNRNHSGFMLAVMLRDSGTSEGDAWAFMQDYQLAVESLGDHPYTVDEAKASLDSAYSKRPQGTKSATVERDVWLMLWLAWHGRLGTKRGDIHGSMRSIFAVGAIMVRAGRTQEVDIPCRSLGVPKSTANRHLDAMCERGPLTRHKSNGRKASRYSLDVDMVRDLARVADFSGRDSTFAGSFTELQSLAIFRRGARFDVRLQPKGEPMPADNGLGPAAHRALAALYEVSHDPCTDGTNNRVQGIGFAYLSHPCTGEHELADIDSITAWGEIAGVSLRTIRQIAKTMHALGVIDFEFGPRGAKIPYLTANWYERLVELDVRATTFGHDVLHAIKHEKQRFAYHCENDRLIQPNEVDAVQWSKRLEYRQKWRNSRKAYHDAEAAKAETRLSHLVREFAAVNEHRRMWCTTHGMEFVPVSLHRESNRDANQESVINGRRMGKEVRAAKFDAAALARKNPRQAERIYAKLLKLVNPNDGEKQRAAQLAAALGKPPPEYRRYDLAAD